MPKRKKDLELTAVAEHQRAGKAKRMSVSEKNRVLENFDAALKKGSTSRDAAKGSGASLASIYRWQRSRNPAGNMPAPTAAQELDIETAIDILVSDHKVDRLSMLEAVFKFVSWIRWPATPHDHPVAITTCVVSYLAQKESVGVCENLSPEGLRLLLRHLRVDTMTKMFSERIFAFPIFTLYPLDSQNYSEMDFLADIAWFIVAYQPPSGDPRDRASLNKAYYASQHHLFRYQWSISSRTFRSFWATYGAASPFHYAERHHPGLEFTLDPSQESFAEQVDLILASKSERVSYFAKCLSAVELLRAVAIQAGSYAS